MEETRKGDEFVSERRRSRSGVTDSAGAEGEGGLEEAVLNALDERAEETGEEGEEGEEAEETVSVNELDRPLRLVGNQRGARGRRLVKKSEKPPPKFTPEQRLLILDTWKRSGLPATEFAPLIGVTNHTLYGWRRKFERYGPAGLMDRPRGGPKGSRLPEVTKRTILMLKEANPEYGCQRISDMLARGPGLPASPGAVGKVLHEAGYVLEEVKTRPHRDRVRRFERSKPNQMWQSDLFTFILKRQNRRVYLVAFLDDHSRFVVGYGLYASQSAALVLETLRASISSYGTPEEILTDNGAQYVTWRGKSAFSKELEKRGIKHLVSKPKRPQTLGKIERLWGTLWRECVETSVFLDLEDARRRVGLFLDHYNFHRVHQGIGGLVPADRFFGAAPEMLRTLKERVAANALELARNGVPKKPFYVTGQVGGKSFSVHAAGERMYLTSEGKGREEIELVGPEEPEGESEEESVPEPVTPIAGMGGHGEAGNEKALPPGVSALDGLTGDGDGEGRS
jgi:transposase InsO family protein